MKPRLHLALVVALAAVAVPASPAQAKLRSPHLSASCTAGYVYSEARFGPWLVEGCNKDVPTQGKETHRREFKGPVELNGLLVEGSTPLYATTIPDGAESENHIIRDDARLILDPKIHGNRRKMTFYDGALNLRTTVLPKPFDDPGLDLPPSVGQPVILPATPQSYNDDVTLPVNHNPSLLGLRMRSPLDGVHVAADQSGHDASLEFQADLTFGSATSSLLRDWVGHAGVTTEDGTGMTFDKLHFKIPAIEIPGIGGFEDVNVAYSETSDEWSGGLQVDFGDLFTAPDFDFSMAVSASTGVPTEIKAAVDNLNLPVGDTGIFLQGIRAGFDSNPLAMSAGATATAGPRIGNSSVIEMSGDLALKFEPNFRMEAKGSARMLPTGPDSQIARGDVDFVIDDSGFISIEGSADYQVLLLGVGAGAEIGGSGAYSSTSDKFNIQAHATGTLYLGFLGSIDIAHYAAVVSSNGWAACGTITWLINAGVGQRWDGNPTLFLSCDLGPYEAVVPGSHARQAAAGDAPSRTFDVPAGVNRLGLEITADGPEPDVTITGPGGAAVSTLPTGTRVIADRVGIIAPAGSAQQYVLFDKPAAGTYTLSWPAGGSQVTGLRTARDIAPVSARVSVAKLKGKPGRRRLVARAIKGIGQGETVTLGVRLEGKGIRPIGSSDGKDLAADFDELPAGPHDIVATVQRDGIDLPARTRVVAHFTSTPPKAPAKLSILRRGSRLRLMAKPAAGAELPDMWQYVLRRHGLPIGLFRAAAGKAATFRIGAQVRGLSVTVRPVVGRRVLRGKALVKGIGR